MNIISNKLSYSFSFSDLSSAAIGGHIHGPANSTSTAGVLISFSVQSATFGTFSGSATLTSDVLFDVISGLTYANIHTTPDPNSEIRGAPEFRPKGALLAVLSTFDQLSTLGYHGL